jgi:ribonuclease P protein component
MLPIPNRLRKSSDITRVYRQGRYGGGGDLSLKARPNHLPESRAVVVVGKKVDKRAVVRNRLRRRCAAALVRLWKGVPAGYDIVVTVHQDISELPVAQLDHQITQALRRAGAN